MYKYTTCLYFLVDTLFTILIPAIFNRYAEPIKHLLFLLLIITTESAMACKCAKSIKSIEDRTQVAFKNATALALATAEKVEDIEPFTQGMSNDKDQLKKSTLSISAYNIFNNQIMKGRYWRDVSNRDSHCLL